MNKLNLNNLNGLNGNGRFDKEQQPKAQQRRRLRAKGEGQQRYIDTIERCDITFCLGPAGTGKTHCSAGVAAKLLQSGEVDRIVGIRPTIELGRSLGFLPGDLDDKLHPYLRPLLTELAKFIGADDLRRYRSGEVPVIELGALAYLRGTSFEDSIVILDEAQNATHAELWMFLTRLSYGSKLIINGDVTQSDLPYEEQGALEHFAVRFADMEEIATVTMTEEDCVRHPVVARMLKRQAKGG